jgi:hypothetical protein
MSPKKPKPKINQITKIFKLIKKEQGRKGRRRLTLMCSLIADWIFNYSIIGLSKKQKKKE